MAQGLHLLNTIILVFKYVYWYMKQISGERLQDHWSSGSFSIVNFFPLNLNLLSSVHAYRIWYYCFVALSSYQFDYRTFSMYMYSYFCLQFQTGAKLEVDIIEKKSLF